MTAILPFLPSNALIELPIIAFSAGIMMKTFTGSQIENHPFVIFMTSGNYRRMLTAIYYAIEGSGDQREYRRQAINYSFVVGKLCRWCYYLSPSDALYPDLVNLG